MKDFKVFCVVVLALVAKGFIHYRIGTYEPYRIEAINDPTSCYYIPEHKRDSMFLAMGRPRYVWYDDESDGAPYHIYMSSWYRYCSVIKHCGEKGRGSSRTYRLPQGVYDELFPEYEELMKERVRRDIQSILSGQEK